MVVNRRTFLQAALSAPLAAQQAAARDFAFPGVWRTFDVTCKLDIGEPMGAVRAWVPLPLARPVPYQRGAYRLSGNATEMTVAHDAESGATMAVAEWIESGALPS